MDTKNIKNQFTLEITTTALCNLGCTYCFEGVKTNKQRLDDKVDVVKQRIYELLESDWYKTEYGSLNISFWGGEPTLNGTLIVDIMKEFQERDDVEFHIYTNAYNRKRLDQVIDNVDISKLQIQVSYDGKEINDQFRLSLTGKPTSDEVVGNVEYLARRGVNVSLKSTIPLKTMDTLYRTWKDFEQLYEKLHAIGPNIHVSYSPTIDYVEEIPRENLDELIASFRKDMIRIAKEEIKFYKKHHRHLCSWFAGSDSKMHCASGANMHAIDVDGNSYACHGSLYSPNKESMKGGSILDDNWLDAVIAMSKSYREAIKVVPETCVNCEATTCMICPVSSLDNSKNTDFFDRWTDRWVNNMCGFFKAFGEIDRTVQAYLYNEISVLDKKDLQEEKV
jgi:uncharacterized protein